MRFIRRVISDCERPKTVAGFLSEFRSSKDRLAKFRAISAVVGFAILSLVILYVANVYLDRLKSRTDFRKKHGESIEMRYHIKMGLDAYQTGDMSKAALHLGYGMASTDFDPTDFKGVDIKGIYEDALRRQLLNR